MQLLRYVEKEKNLFKQKAATIRDGFLNDFGYLEDYRKVELAEKRRLAREEMKYLENYRQVELAEKRRLAREEMKRQQEEADKLWHEERESFKK